MIKFCKDCKWSEPEERSAWNLRCHNPEVNSKDSWALANGRMEGTSTRSERELRWFYFPKCGMSGKLWEQKQT